MFNKPGEKIQVVANIFFKLAVLCCLIAGFYYASIMEYALQQLFVAIAMIVAILLSYCVILLFTGFGKLVESAERIAESK